MENASRSSPTLHSLTENLGIEDVTVVSAPRGLEVEIARVVFHDPSQPSSVSTGDLVLGIGLRADPALGAVLRDLGDLGAAGVVVKVDHLDDAVLQQVRRGPGCALISISSDVSWLQLAMLIRGVLVQLDNEPQPQYSPDDDLFAVANAIAAAAGGPVLLEDEHHRHIAYSEHSRDVDPLRMATILLRRTPEDMTPLHNNEHYTKLAASDRPVYFNDLGPGQDRLAMAIRVDGQIVGWAWAVAPKPPKPDTLDAFSGAVRDTALHVLRHRIELDRSRRSRAEMVLGLLEGRSEAKLTADQLGLKSKAYRVIACTTRTLAAEGLTTQGRFWDLIATHAQLLPGAPPSALNKGTVHLILPVVATPQAESDHAKSVANRLAAALVPRFSESTIGIGRIVERLADLPLSRHDADRVLDAIRVFPRLPKVADIAEVQLHAFLLDGLNLPADELEIATGPIASLAKHDQDHGSTYVQTLIAYLDSFGDVAAAAAALQVHVNTLRYRVRKLQILSGLNLEDPDQRLAVMFELRYRTLHQD